MYNLIKIADNDNKKVLSAESIFFALFISERTQKSVKRGHK